MADPPSLIQFATVGDNPARLFGMTAVDRARRIAENVGLEAVETPTGDGPAILSNMAFAWDPAWLREIAGRPGAVLTLDGKPVLAHAEDAASTAAIEQAMIEGGAPPAGM